MTNYIQDRTTNIERWPWTMIILLVVFSTVMMFNSMFTKSPFIGIPISLAILYICAVATGEIFFSNEKRFLRQTLGLATFFLFLALLGTFLILVAKFTETLSLVSFIAIGLILCFFSALKKRKKTSDLSEPIINSKSKGVEPYLLVFPYLLSIAIAFFALLLARTGEGELSVWYTIPNFFLPVFFLASLILVMLVFFTNIHYGLKLTFIFVYSFLSHSLFLLVWYPGRYGDPWVHLGEARFIERTGTFYAYDWLFSQGLVTDIVKYKAQYALVGFFSRMFTLDIYWVHVFFIPLLWSFFVTIFSYKLAELLSAKKNRTFPLLSAISVGLFSPLVIWGAVSVPNSLGFLLFFFSIMLLLYWVDTHSKRVWFLSLLAAIAAFFAHPQNGIFACIFVVGALIIQSRLHRILKIVFFPVVSSAYLYISYLQNAKFSLEGFLNLENFLSFQYNLTTFLLIFGFLGLVFSVRGKLVKGRIAILLFLFYITTAANYFITMFGMKDAPLPERILPMLDLLLVPFVALGIMITTNFLKTGFSHVKAKANPSKKVMSARSVAVLMICLFLSAQTTFALFQAYPRSEITEVQPAAYEVEAIYYIDSTAAGRYIVLGDTNLATLAVGLLGIDYSYGAYARGTFGIADWSWWTMQLYVKMARNPSLSVLEEAMYRAKSGVSYFVVSVREPEYASIVARTEEVVPVDMVFGDGRLTVFKYVSTIVPIGGNGPDVKVSFDGGPFTNVQSTFNYFFKSEVTYTVKLSGYSSYNISNYPTYWTFLSLQVNDKNTQFEESSDVNTFIYKTGLSPTDALEVNWRANEYYPRCGWKDDSFKSGWQTHPLFQGTISPYINTDGNILSISWNFTQGPYQYYYYVKNATLATNDYPYVLMRWKSTARIAYATVAYTDSESIPDEVIPIGSESGDWTVTIMKLKPNMEIAFVMVGITNLGHSDIEGPQTLEVDYILISAP